MPEIPIQPQPTSNQKSINWKNILIGAVIGAVLVGVGVLIFYLYQTNSEETTPITTPNTSTPSAKIATPSAKKDETVDWKTVVNDVLGYSIKHPKDWGALRCLESGTDLIDDKEIMYHNPESSKVLAGADMCRSGARTRIVISRKNTFSEKVTSWDKSGPTKYTGYKKENIIVDSVDGVKVNATVKQVPGLPEGLEIIEYVFDDGKDKALIINDYRYPAYDSNPQQPDYSDILEKMVSTLKFLD